MATLPGNYSSLGPIYIATAVKDAFVQFCCKSEKKNIQTKLKELVHDAIAKSGGPTFASETEIEE